MPQQSGRWGFLQAYNAIHEQALHFPLSHNGTLCSWRLSRSYKAASTFLDCASSPHIKAFYTETQLYRLQFCLTYSAFDDISSIRTN